MVVSLLGHQLAVMILGSLPLDPVPSQICFHSQVYNSFPTQFKHLSGKTENPFTKKTKNAVQGSRSHNFTSFMKSNFSQLSSQLCIAQVPLNVFLHSRAVLTLELILLPSPRARAKICSHIFKQHFGFSTLDMGRTWQCSVENRGRTSDIFVHHSFVTPLNTQL